MRSRLTKILLPAVVAALALVAPPPATAADPLQPGARIGTTIGSCTANFVYDGAGDFAGKVYLGTAAHCVSKVGDPVRDGAGVTFGKVAFIGPWDRTANDFAFIEVAAAHVDRVSPAMKGHPQFPTGVAVDAETTTGDLVQFSGYGVGWSWTETTREERVGVLMLDDDDVQRVHGSVTWGDSGGPVVHIPSGKALGIATEICAGSAICTEKGPTIDGVLRRAAAGGFTVTLRTV